MRYCNGHYEVLQVRDVVSSRNLKQMLRLKMKLPHCVSASAGQA